MLTKKLLARRRAVMIEGTALEYVELARRGTGWRLLRHRRERSERLDTVIAEERLLRKGAALVHCDLPLILTPPPGIGESEEEWERGGPRELLGVTTCVSVLEPRHPPRVAGWWRDGELERVASEHAWCDAAIPESMLIVQALEPRRCPAVWSALRVGESTAYLWLMKGEQAQHGCRLAGGAQDLPLLRRELTAALDALQGDRSEWGGVGIGLIGSHARVEEMIAEMGCDLLEFPWSISLERIPLDVRWVAAAAAADASSCPWENWGGPAHREEIAIGLGLRSGAAGLSLLLVLGGILMGLSLWNGHLNAQVSRLDSELAPSGAWLRSLDSMERMGGASQARSATAGLAAIANCSSPKLHFLAWKSADAPMRHSLEILAESEAVWLGMKGCLENAGLFDVVATRAIELRKDGKPGERARIFAEVKER